MSRSEEIEKGSITEECGGTTKYLDKRKRLGKLPPALSSCRLNNSVLSTTRDNDNEHSPPSVAPTTHGVSFLKNLIEDAKNEVQNDTPQVRKPKKAKAHDLTAEELNRVTWILKSLHNTHERERKSETRHCNPKKLSNDSHSNRTRSTRVAHIPYAVSDTFAYCKQCTSHRACPRHCKPHFLKTDISLCSKSHFRMAISWAISDPDNRHGTWRFSINEHFDSLADPRSERHDHEAAQAAKQDQDPGDRSGTRKRRRCLEKADGKWIVSEKDTDCQPVEPKWRIKQLAQHIIADYNKEQSNSARIANLDYKGREYFVKSKVWGGKDPFTPSEGAATRAKQEYGHVDGGRVEIELRVLLAAWYRGMSGSVEGVREDWMSASAKRYWREKMEVVRAKRDGGGEMGVRRCLVDRSAGKLEEGQKISKDRHRMVRESLRPVPAKRSRTVYSEKKPEVEGVNRSKRLKRSKTPSFQLTDPGPALLSVVNLVAEDEGNELDSSEISDTKQDILLEPENSQETAIPLTHSPTSQQLHDRASTRASAMKSSPSLRTKPAAQPRSTQHTPKKRKRAVVAEEIEVAVKKKSIRQYKCAEVIQDSDDDVDTVRLTREALDVRSEVNTVCCNLNQVDGGEPASQGSTSSKLMLKSELKRKRKVRFEESLDDEDRYEREVKKSRTE